MVINDQLDNDIRSFFEQIDGQTKDGKRDTLKNLIDKYAHLNTSEQLLNHADLKTIVSNARNLYSNFPFPVTIGDKYMPVVDRNSIPNLCVIEATIGTLNSYDCFKRFPKFDYRKR